LVGGRIPTGASRSWRPCRWRGTRCRPPPTAGPRPRTHAPETGTLGGGENAVWEAFSPPTPPQRICPKGIVLPKLFSPHGPARFSPTFSLGARMRRTGSAPPPPVGAPVPRTAIRRLPSLRDLDGCPITDEERVRPRPRVGDACPRPPSPPPAGALTPVPSRPLPCAPLIPFWGPVRSRPSPRRTSLWTAGGPPPEG